MVETISSSENLSYSLSDSQMHMALAWAAASHQRLGNQIGIKSLRTVAENTDLIRRIILAVITTY